MGIVVFAILNFFFGWTEDWVSFVFGLPSLIVALTQMKVFMPKVLKDQIRKEQEDFWKTHHPEYEKALEEKNNLVSMCNQIEKSISLS